MAANAPKPEDLVDLADLSINNYTIRAAGNPDPGTLRMVLQLSIANLSRYKTWLEGRNLADERLHGLTGEARRAKIDEILDTYQEKAILMLRG